jgi:hypothetical protein
MQFPYVLVANEDEALLLVCNADYSSLEQISASLSKGLNRYRKYDYDSKPQIKPDTI